MASAATWLELLAAMKAAFDFAKSGLDYTTSFRKHKAERETQLEAERVSVVFTTYSEDEVKALTKRVEGCRERFIEQGGGKDRHRCICSVLNEASLGNGGRLPEIDDWRRMYEELACPSPA
jgi:hypothetical protein